MFGEYLQALMNQTLWQTFIRIVDLHLERQTAS